MDRSLNDMYPQELRQLIRDMDKQAYRGDQVFNFFHVQKGLDLAGCSNLPKGLIKELDKYPIRKGRIIGCLKSADLSRKYLLEFKDQAIIEAVFMPYEDRNTLCLSSQVGCKMGCLFCASTKANFQRNLTAAEMLLEVYLIEKDLDKRIDNIVIMGIGEPLDNFDELTRFLRLICHEMGKNLSQRSITISTSGLVPNIYKLADLGMQVNLAISLHASDDKSRAMTMPIARKYSIDQIKEACKYYFDKTGRRISLEYVLIEGQNDSDEDIKKLVRNFKGPGWHINLIALNRIEEFKGKALDKEKMEIFKNKLIRQGLNVTVRKKRGADIDAACGQLRLMYQRKEAGIGEL